MSNGRQPPLLELNTYCGYKMLITQYLFMKKISNLYRNLTQCKALSFLNKNFVKKGWISQIVHCLLGNFLVITTCYNKKIRFVKDLNKPSLSVRKLEYCIASLLQFFIKNTNTNIQFAIYPVKIDIEQIHLIRSNNDACKVMYIFLSNVLFKKQAHYAYIEMKTKNPIIKEKDLSSKIFYYKYPIIIKKYNCYYRFFLDKKLKT
ncbi:hypothetical protein [Candidatus Liberibacter solanacearum]|nr:hypothetical protein [Candidatus Liberibacter solanacearum]